MKYWADKVRQLAIHCPECQRIAQRILRGEPLLYREKTHIEHDVAAAAEAFRGRIRDGVEAFHTRRAGKGKGGITEKKSHGHQS
jgi:hypothetical protein